MAKNFLMSRLGFQNFKMFYFNYKIQKNCVSLCNVLAFAVSGSKNYHLQCEYGAHLVDFCLHFAIITRTMVTPLHGPCRKLHHFSVSTVLIMICSVIKCFNVYTLKKNIATGV
jgi:hypothetical protein